MKHLLAGTALLLTLTAGAQAAPWGSRYDNIDRRQYNQQQRIQDGIRSGRLTPREARDLERREAALRYQENMMRRNGLNPMERARLQREQDQLSRDISRQLNDRQRRW